VDFESRRFIVSAMERNRISKVHIEKLPVDAEETEIAGS